MNQKIIDKEIVKDIARGMSDSELTQKYNLLGNQLRSIFKQLGKLRAKKIQTLASDLRSGMARSELKKKYQLSSEALASSLKSLLKANAITSAEFETFRSFYGEQRTERDLRGTPRNHPIPVVTVYEVGRPGTRYRVRDISENGISIIGIRAQIDEMKSLAVVGDEFGEIASFEFESQCRWARQLKPDGEICAGFRITSIDEHDLLRLREFIQVQCNLKCESNAECRVARGVVTMDSTHSGPDDSKFLSGDYAVHPQSQLPVQGRGETFVPRFRSNHTDGDFGTTPSDYIEIIIRKRWVVLTLFIVIVLITATYTFTCTPIFSSVATIEFEEKRPKQEDRVYGDLDYDQSKAYLATQLEILKSRSLAESLVAKMKLSESPEFSSKSSWIGGWVSAPVSWLFGSNDQESAEDASTARINSLSASVLGRVSVKPVKTSNLVAVSMDASNPEFANEILRNYLDIYLEGNLAKRRKESLEASAWLKEELAAVDKKLMESQAELVGFLIDNRIVVSSTETGVSPVMDVLNKTMETHTKSHEARLRMQALEQQKASEQGAVLPKDVNTEYVGKLKEQVALFESEYSQMKGLYSSEYPKMEMLNQKIKFLKERISEIEKSIVASALDTAKKEESLFKGSVDLARGETNRVKALGAQHMLLKKEVETNEEFHQMLVKECREYDIKSRIINNNVRIIDPPSKPHKPRWPKKGLFLVIGSLIGLVGGIAAAFVLERLDNTVRTPEEIERDFKVRRLAIVPDLDTRWKLHGTKLTATSYEFIAHEHPKSPMSDAVRNIQASIFLSNAHRPLSCMAVSSAIPSEGKTLISISLATVLCSSEKKVVIVDADMRKPKVHTVFGHREPGPGLSTLLGLKGGNVSDILHPHTIKGLFYITSGPAVSDHLPLLQSERMKKLVNQLRSTFDYIVFDTPPVLGFSDVSILCTYADGLILVAKEGHVGRDQLREAINETSSMNGRGILGVVLNKAHAPWAAYGYASRYGFRYGNGYY